MSDKNPFHAPATTEGSVAQVEQHRAVQEVQAAMIIAKKFPRDQHAAFTRIMSACERINLAEAASYSYPRGKQMITGPTIRLAEVMAQNWGNMEFGIRELSQEGNESEVQAFAWDMETNVRQSKTFRVPHKMKARGTYKHLDDPRDIYELVANMGARRLRACILGVIPGDIVDAAVSKCEKTLIGGDPRPLDDMVRGMLEKFKAIEVSQELIEERLQHKTTAIVRSQLAELGKIYNSIKDGMSKRSDWFNVPVSQQGKTSPDLDEKLKETKKDTKKPEIVDPDEAGESTGTEGEENTDYFQSNFTGLKGTFEGKLRNHIKTGKADVATAADIAKLREKWNSHKTTQDKEFPMDDPEEQLEEQNSQQGTGNAPLVCHMRKGDPMETSYCDSKCLVSKDCEEFQKFLDNAMMGS